MNPKRASRGGHVPLAVRQRTIDVLPLDPGPRGGTRLLGRGEHGGAVSPQQGTPIAKKKGTDAHPTRIY